MNVIQLLGSESVVTTATDLGSAKLVRVCNSGTAGNSVVITLRDDQAAIKGTITILGGDTINIQKLPTDTIEAAGTGTANAVAIAFRG